jgi:hypothetical protein
VGASEKQDNGAKDGRHVIVSLSAGIAYCTSRPRKRVKPRLHMSGLKTINRVVEETARVT